MSIVRLCLACLFCFHLNTLLSSVALRHWCRLSLETLKTCERTSVYIWCSCLTTQQGFCLSSHSHLLHTPKINDAQFLSGWHKSTWRKHSGSWTWCSLFRWDFLLTIGTATIGHVEYIVFLFDLKAVRELKCVCCLECRQCVNYTTTLGGWTFLKTAFIIKKYI